MFFLLYKFFKESILLVDYILYFYLANIVVITFLQLLFFIFIYNFFSQLKIKIRESGKNYLMENNTNLIKNILITYHQEQIIFITKLFDNKIVQQLFPDTVSNKTNKNIESPSKMTTVIQGMNNNNEKIFKAIDFLRNFDKKNEKKSDNKIKYPELPESPKEIST